MCVDTKNHEKIALDRTTERCLTHVTSPKKKTDCDLGSWGKGLFNLNSTCRNFALFCWKSCVVSSGFFLKKSRSMRLNCGFCFFFGGSTRKKSMPAPQLRYTLGTRTFPEKKGERYIKTYSRKLTDVLFPSTAQIFSFFLLRYYYPLHLRLIAAKIRGKGVRCC